MLDYPLPPQGLSVCHMSKWSHHVLSEVLDHQEFLPQTSELNINKYNNIETVQVNKNYSKQQQSYLRRPRAS